jgi:hypothetical protein
MLKSGIAMSTINLPLADFVDAGPENRVKDPFRDTFVFDLPHSNQRIGSPESHSLELWIPQS